jgi:hypothetical protein
MNNHLTFLFILFFAIPVSLQAYVVTNGQTMNLTSPFTLNQDLIIQNGGSVNVQSVINVAIGHKIIIESGGRLIGQNGTFTSTQGGWAGIVVNDITSGAVFTEALHLESCTISNVTSSSAILFSPLNPASVYPSTYVYDTRFEDNYSDFRSDQSSAGSSDDHNSGTHDKSFISCTFSNTGSFKWSHWLINMNNVTFSRCFFDKSLTQDDDLGVHLNSLNNLKIYGCSFYYMGSTAIAFHGYFNNAIVDGNYFYYRDYLNTTQMPNNAAAISIGYLHQKGYLYDSFIENNHFVSGDNEFTKNYRGISSGGNFTQNPLYFVEGWCYNTKIRNNQFEYLDVGIYSFYLSENSEISGNDFDTYRSALFFDGTNEDLMISCNRFYIGSIGIRIESGTMPDLTLNNEDYNNAFINSNTDIMNNSGIPWVYPYHPSAFYPPIAVNNDVDLPRADFITNCTQYWGVEGENKKESSKVEFSADELVLSPNPASEMISIQGLKTNTLVSIYNLEGKIVLQVTLFNEGNDNIDISTLNNGFYLLQLQSEEYSETKKICVLK